MPLHRAVAALLLAGVLAAGVGAAPLSAQTGTIAGRVVSRYDGLPLAQSLVQVRNQTTSIAGVLTSADGRYTIHAIPPGVYTVTVASIGYAPARPTTFPGRM